MGNRSYVLVIVLVLVATLAFSGGQKEKAAPTVATGEPQYGGTFSPWWYAGQNSDPGSPAFSDAQFSSLPWLEWICERPLIGDTETYGPRGSGEYKFQDSQYIPEKYLKGNLLESYEVSPEKLVWHVRPGIYWQDVPHVMNARELTADDIAADILRFLDSPWNSRFAGLINSDGISVVDKYTLEIEFESYSPMVMYFIGYEDRAIITPPETEIAGANKWENQVGTGPFMFKEYVVGSHMTYVKNPNYWGKTTINGKEYKLPFIDKVVMHMIPDVSAQIAALKTAVLDIHLLPDATMWGMLDSVAPDLKYLTYWGASTQASVMFRCDEPPFDNVDVRRAMIMGTDSEAFKKMAMATGAPTLYLPVRPGNPAYVSLEQLPRDISMLYKYDPVRAKKMIIDAGYPGGFSTTLLAQNVALAEDTCAMLADQWAKIGVDVKIDIRDRTGFTELTYAMPKPKYHGAVHLGPLPASPLSIFTYHFVSGKDTNYSAYSNAKFDALVTAAAQETDADEQNNLLREASLMLLGDAVNLGLHFDPGRVYFWPWVKNYYGELSLQDDSSWCAVAKFIWLDQELKKEMGY